MLDRSDADSFLADLDGIAEAVWLCGEGAEHVGTTGHERAFLALRQAIFDRTESFRRQYGLPPERPEQEPC
jgi:hypothetical protein